MTYIYRLIIPKFTFILISGFCIFVVQSFVVNAQNSPLKYSEIITALTAKIPNQFFKNKDELISYLIAQIKQRKVNKSLNEDREDDLRQAGATDELIVAIKENSPQPKTNSSSLSTPITPVPTPTPKPAYINYIERGDEFFNKFDFDRAIEEYTKAVELDSQNVYALVQRGYAHHYKGDSASDFADYNSAAKIKPDLASEPSFICVIYDSIKDDADIAVENCGKAISTKANFSLFYYKRANAYRQKKDLEKAISDYNEAIKFYPNFYSAFLNRGGIYAAKLDYEKAVKDFDKMVVINPKNSAGYFVRGRLYRDRKDYNKALTEFDKIPQIDYKSTSMVYLECGLTYQFQNLPAQAENEFDKAIDFDPKFAPAYNARGWLNFTRSKEEQAIFDLTKAIELNPKFGVAYFNRAQVYERKKDYVRAIADLDKAIEISPQSSGAYNIRGLYYFRQGDYENALKDYNKAIEIQPNNITYRNRANVYEKLGNKDLAQSDRDNAINDTNRIKIIKNKDADTTSSFVGKVYGKNKKPIYNAQVVIMNINIVFSALTRTDKNGRFEKDGLPPGRYKIQISAPGYETKTVEYPLYAKSKVENVNPFILEPEKN